MKRFFSFLWPLYIGEFFRSLTFFLPIWILFFQSRGLSLADIGFVATGTYIASFLLEYPTGIFADKYGRKLSIIISVLLSLVAIILEVTAYSKIQFFIAALFVGASWAFVSGAREALIYDELKQKKLEKYNSKVLGSLDTVSALGGITSASLGSIFFVWKNTLPYWLTACAYVLTFIFFILIKEAKYKQKGASAYSFGNFIEGMKLVFRNPVLKSLLLLFIPLFFFEEAWYNAQQPILVGIGLPIAFLGVYYALKAVFVAAGGIALPRLLEKFNHKILLFVVIVAEFLVWVFLGSNNLYLVIVFAYFLILCHQLWNYIDADIIHEHIPSHIRATTISGRQMLISLIWIFNPWLMGYLVNSFNRNYLFPIFAVIILVTALIIFFSRRKHF